MTRRPPRRAFLYRVVGLLAVCMLPGGCTGAGHRDASARADGLPNRGTTLPTALARPHFTLTDTDGQPFDFYARTKGSVTLVVTGYTNCPDVCPVHLSAISGILRRVPALRDSVSVIFLSADPMQDTPGRIREWLRQFDANIVGLTGSIAAVDSAQAALAESPGVRTTDATRPGYAVQHAAQVIAFTADDSAHWVYPFGTRQVDWDADLPRLVGFARAASARR